MKISNLIADDKNLDRISASKVITLFSASALIFGFIYPVIAHNAVDDTLAWILACLAGTTKITPQILSTIKEIKSLKNKVE